MKRKVIAMFEVDDDRAIEKDMGTLDFLESELDRAKSPYFLLENARVLDDDDLYDIEAVKMAELIFEESE